MKGVILAGGLGTRLRPLTLVTNKHLLPVYDRPMIYYPIECLLNAGIRRHPHRDRGRARGRLPQAAQERQAPGRAPPGEYAYQEGEGGIADALKLAEEFADGEKICVVLGDNIIEKQHPPAAGDFFTQPAGRQAAAQGGPRSRSGSAWRASRARAQQAVEIIEKPDDPPSNYAVTGIYFYDPTCSDLPHAQAQRPRRTGDHRCEQRLPRARRPDPRDARRAGGPMRARSRASTAPPASSRVAAPTTPTSPVHPARRRRAARPLGHAPSAEMCHLNPPRAPMLPRDCRSPPRPRESESTSPTPSRWRSTERASREPGPRPLLSPTTGAGRS
jgi:glucose-1-phosphate thymidylyltransferase